VNLQCTKAGQRREPTIVGQELLTTAAGHGVTDPNFELTAAGTGSSRTLTSNIAGHGIEHTAAGQEIEPSLAGHGLEPTYSNRTWTRTYCRRTRFGTYSSKHEFELKVVGLQDTDSNPRTVGLRTLV
jgi:hypothetical protein